MLQPHSLHITVNHWIWIEQSQGKELTPARRGAPVPGEAPVGWWQQFLALTQAVSQKQPDLMAAALLQLTLETWRENTQPSSSPAGQLHSEGK